MVRISALFLAVIGSSLVSALAVPASDIESRAAAVTFIKHVNVYYTDGDLKKGVVSIDVDINTSPDPVEVIVDSVSAIGQVGGVNHLTVAHTFPSPGLAIPAHTTKNTGRINDVKANPNLDKTKSIIDASSIVIKYRAGGVSKQLTGNESNIPIKYIKSG